MGQNGLSLACSGPQGNGLKLEIAYSFFPRWELYLLEMPYLLAEWAHITSYLREVTALTDWEYRHGDTTALVKVVANSCLLCFQTRPLEGSQVGTSALDDRPYSESKLVLLDRCCPLLELVGTQPPSVILSLESC